MNRRLRLLSSSVAIFAITVLANGCTGAGKKAGPYRPVPKSDGSAEAPVSEESTSSGRPGGIVEETTDGGGYGPAPTQIVPVTVILGPGLARGFAHAGVLQGLRREGIPIGMIAGTGVGALIGALYAVSGNDNDFDWALQKVREDLFFESSLSLSKLLGGPSSGKHLRTQLTKLFKKQSFASTRVPLRIGIQSELANSFEFVGKGRLAGVLRVALSEKGLFEDSEWFGAPSWSASAMRPFPVKESREIVNAPVLAVNVLDDEAGERAAGEAERRYANNMRRAVRSARSSLARADLVLEPKMINVGYFDFSRRSEAVYAGRKMVEEKIAEIRQITGLPPKEASR